MGLTSRFFTPSDERAQPAKSAGVSKTTNRRSAHRRFPVSSRLSMLNTMVITKNALRALITAAAVGAPVAADAACTGRLNIVAKALTGAWAEFDVADDGAETLIGEIEYRLEADGCAFTERYTSTHGDASVAFAFPDPTIDGWAQVEVSARDGAVERRVMWIDGAEIIIESDARFPSLVQPRAENERRTRLFPTADGSIKVTTDSTEDGLIWKVVGQGVLRRVE